MKNLFIILFALLLASCSKDGGSPTINSDDKGKNGSITRFAIKDNFMYAIDINYVRIFDITAKDNPLLVQSVMVANGLETIVIYGNQIFLGAVNGVYVLNINDPTHPIQMEKIEHHISCDPVVVQNNYAYSTQRINTTGCGNTWTQSALAVYNVSQPNQSQLVKTITMTSPYGLAVEGNWLFVCDEGKGGVVVFDITNPANPIQKKVTQIKEPRDIITRYPYMVIATNTAFELYNYADPLNMYFISSLSLK